VEAQETAAAAAAVAAAVVTAICAALASVAALRDAVEMGFFGGDCVVVHVVDEAETAEAVVVLVLVITCCIPGGDDVAPQLGHPLLPLLPPPPMPLLFFRSELHGKLPPPVGVSQCFVPRKGSKEKVLSSCAVRSWLDDIGGDSCADVYDSCWC